MASPSKISVIEKVSSLIVISILILVFLLVFYFQSHFDLARLGLKPVSAENAGPHENAPFDMQAIMPQGWGPFGRLENYDTESLYEKINGKAPLYLDSGFSRLYTQKIIRSDNQEDWAEIYVYDMTNGQNAFSVFSVQRRSNAVSIEGLAAGYYTGNAAFAVVGNYYLEIIGSNVSQETVEAVKSVALNFDKSSGDHPAATVSFTNLFPAENLLVDTISLTKSDAFGFELFKDTYIGHYDVDGETITAFVIVCADDANASALNHSYREFLTSNGFQKAVATGSVPDGVYEYSGIFEIVFSKGKFVGGIHEAFDRTAAEQLTLKMMKNFERNRVDGGE